MKRHTETEENYLKAVYRFSQKLTSEKEFVNTNTIANYLDTSPASVTDMFKRLKGKKLVTYQSYKGVRLTSLGEKVALNTIRKHRLWEVFLVEKLNFSWDNVHEMAEQLEHVDSVELIRALDKFLGYPKFDPHGDPIPSEEGEMQMRKTHLLSEVAAGTEVSIVGVTFSGPDFLQYLDQLQLNIGQRIKVVEKLPYDRSLRLQLDKMTIVLNGNIADQLVVMEG